MMGHDFMESPIPQDFVREMLDIAEAAWARDANSASEKWASHRPQAADCHLLRLVGFDGEGNLDMQMQRRPDNIVAVPVAVSDADEIPRTKEVLYRRTNALCLIPMSVGWIDDPDSGMDTVMVSCSRYRRYQPETLDTESSRG